MNYPPSRPERLPNHLHDVVRKVALHEFGHYIAANVMGFETDDVAIEMTDWRGGYRGEAGIRLSRGLRTVPEAERYLRDRVVVLWAGALAETLRAEKVSEDDAVKCLRGEAGASDHAKATELLNLLRNLTSPDVSGEKAQAALTELEEEIWLDTVKLVEAEARLISGFASRLAQMVRMTSTRYLLSRSEISAAPSFAARFGRV